MAPSIASIHAQGRFSLARSRGAFVEIDIRRLLHHAGLLALARDSDTAALTSMRTGDRVK
jgi:hypothetical protein